MTDKYDNDILNQTAEELAKDLKDRINSEDGDETKEAVLGLLRETAGISEEDWDLMLDGNILAFKIERKLGVPLEASVNACMYTNFLLGYYLAQNLSLDATVFPPEWNNDSTEEK